MIKMFLNSKFCILMVLLFLSGVAYSQTATVDLTSHQPTAPTGSSFYWYDTNPNATIGATALSGTAITSAIANTYYGAFYDATSSCYSPAAKVDVVIGTCPIDLSSYITATNIEWYTNSAHTETKLINSIALTSGTYFPFNNNSGTYTPINEVVIVSITALAVPIVIGIFQPVLTTTPINIHTLTLASGTALTIIAGLNFTVKNSIANSGRLTVENNANLIQVCDSSVNTGNIIVQRDSAPIVRLDHTLWSSPVTGVETVQEFSPATLANRFYTYSTSSDAYAAVAATSAFTAGQGIAIRAPNNQNTINPTPWQGTFTGVPNNGIISFGLDDTLSGYNLVGNPYPSTIDAATFLTVNPNIDGTLYFYAHSLSMNADGVFPSGTNYAMWNSSGSTLATHIDGDVHPYQVAPSGIIQVGQGFFVKANASGSINFTNAMRVGNIANQNFRTAAVEKDRLWLNLQTGTGVDINQILVGYITGATQGVDRNYDGLSFGNAGSSLSSKIGTADYVIQGRSFPFDPNDIVSLGFKANAAANYTIGISKSDGLFAGNQEVFLKDALLGTEQSIKVSPYTFSSQAGTFDARFSLVFTKTLGVASNRLNPNSVLVYKDGEWFRVKTNGITMNQVSVYDMSGRLILQQSKINAATTVLKGLSVVNAALLFKIISTDNQTITVKVVN
jgi:hypothetical protein